MRENNEGEYSEIGGRMFPGTDQEMVIQETVFTRRGVRPGDALRLRARAARRKRKLTSATKSNGIIHTMPFWDERFRAVAAELSRMSRPSSTTSTSWRRISSAGRRRFDVVVGEQSVRRHPLRSRPGGDRHDRHRAVGAISIRSGAFPSMFEPVHGSAPDIAGKNIANPIGQIWSGA